MASSSNTERTMAAVSVRSYMSSGVACSLLRTATIHSAIDAASICPAHIHDPGPPNRTLPAAARSNKHRRRFTLIDAPEKPSASRSAATTAVRPSSNLLPAATAAAHRASRRSNVWPFRLMAGILLRTTPLQRRTDLRCAPLRWCLLCLAYRLFPRSSSLCVEHLEPRGRRRHDGDPSGSSAGARLKSR